MNRTEPWTGNDMDTYTDELALVEVLELCDAIHVELSTGGDRASV